MWPSLLPALASRLALAGVVAGVTFASVLTHELEPPLPQAIVQDEPAIRHNADDGTATTELSVLIYNVAALPWPIRGDRTRALELIGDELAAARTNGNAPDIVLIQEGFRRSMRTLIDRSGYPNWVRGPARSDQMPNYSLAATSEFKSGGKWTRAEGLGKITDSGLYVLSDWPILRKETSPFYRSECAGFDCAANKGVLWVEIEVPGMPGHLQMFTTHLNARKSTGAPPERTLEAYGLQIDRLETFVANHWNPAEPLIYGGDFNAKHSPERFALFEAASELPQAIVQRDCVTLRPACELDIASSGDTPWMDTQDWQGWASGEAVSIRPLRVETWFSEEYPDAPEIKGRHTLSDHDALLVTYELSWRDGTTSETLLASAR